MRVPALVQNLFGEPGDGEPRDEGGGQGGPPEPRAQKSQAAFRTISEVADELDVAQHVLRFWESKFPQVRPLKRGGGRRYYRPEDVELLRQIRSLLYQEGYTIKGAQKLLRGRRSRTAVDDDAPPPPPSATVAQPAAATIAAPLPAALPEALSAETLRRLGMLKVELVELKAMLARARADRR